MFCSLCSLCNDSVLKVPCWSINYIARCQLQLWALCWLPKCGAPPHVGPNWPSCPKASPESSTRTYLGPLNNASQVEMKRGNQCRFLEQQQKKNLSEDPELEILGLWYLISKGERLDKNVVRSAEMNVHSSTLKGLQPFLIHAQVCQLLPSLYTSRGNSCFSLLQITLRLAPALAGKNGGTCISSYCVGWRGRVQWCVNATIMHGKQCSFLLGDYFLCKDLFRDTVSRVLFSPLLIQEGLGNRKLYLANVASKHERQRY